MKVARPYQRAALDGGDHRGRGCFKEWEEHQSTLVCLPTGTGKTFVAAEAIKRFEGRAFFVVHLRKIVKQASKELRRMCPGRAVAIEMANSRSSSFYPEAIVCASVKTMNSAGRLNHHNPFDYDLLILDEAHHSASESWIKIIDYFKQNPNLKILFLSATPERHDGKPLSAICQSVAYHYTLKEAIADGYLVAPRQQFAIIPGLDYSEVKKTAGDLNRKDVSLKWEDFKILHAAVQCSVEAVFGLYPRELTDVPENKWSEYIGDRPAKTTLGFTVNVKHAMFMADALNFIRPGLADWVCGETDHDESQRKFLAFENDRCPVLFNYGVTVEGYDLPKIELILDMQPTLSLARLTQKVGRSTRTLPGVIDGLGTAEERKEAIKNSKKPFAVIINFGGKQGKHRIVSSLDLLGGIMTPQVKEKVEELAKEKAVDIEEAVADAQEDERKRLIEEQARAIVKTNYALDNVDIFTGKKKKPKLSKLEKEARRIAREKQPISTKQWELLVKQKLHPENRTPDENKRLLKDIAHRRLAHLCSYGQASVLRRYGYSKEQLRAMKSYEASKLIDAIAKNNWRKPAELTTASEPSFGVAAF